MLNTIVRPLTFCFGGLILLILQLLLSSCSKPQLVEIPFLLTYQQQPINCDPLSSPDPNVKLKDFRLYIHAIELQNSESQWVTLALTPDGHWQNATTALLDFENNSNECDSGNPATNTQIIGTLPLADQQVHYQAIRFKIGVPFELNHQDPLLASAPLNESTLHWHWQGGYKFIRAEFNLNHHSRRLHIGSLQCQGEINAISHCNKPNRAAISLAPFDLQKSAVVIAIDDLIDFAGSTDQTNLTCMGDDEHPWCANALDWIGLNPTKPQTAFSVSAN